MALQRKQRVPTHGASWRPGWPAWPLLPLSPEHTAPEHTAPERTGPECTAPGSRCAINPRTRASATAALYSQNAATISSMAVSMMRAMLGAVVRLMDAR
ncbi:hypothetical protein D9M68_935570 [compost metagenome]